MKVAEMIRKTRIESGLTQEEYGVRFGVTRQTVSSWENERSLPDLQMLIDICNTYHVSLDRLLNDDKAFVDKIDYYSKFKRIIKRVAVLVLIVLVLFFCFFIRWKSIANDKNEAFTGAAKQMGFLKERAAGMYILRQDGINFSLPNQKLPFLKYDFYVKNAYAAFMIDGTEIDITIYDDLAFTIELNHYRSVKGVISEGSRMITDESTLSQEEQRFYEQHEDKIKDVLKYLAEIHNAVYRE